MLTPLTETPEEHAYDLCVSHATRTSPPRGWLLQDRRPDLQPTGRPVDPDFLASADTVAVLARALRAVPDNPDHLDSLADLVDPLEEAANALDAAAGAEHVRGMDAADLFDASNVADAYLGADRVDGAVGPGHATDDPGQPALEW
jgi:hypothetical protein